MEQVQVQLRLFLPHSWEGERPLPEFKVLSLRVRTLAPKKMEETGSVTKVTVKWGRGEEESSGGMGKSPPRWI